MTSMFDYDDSVNLAFDAKIAGKNMVAAKHELLTKTGDFLFLAHSERELAYRMQMVEEDIEKIAYRKLASVSDSKAKLVRTVLDEWQLRHASCEMCRTAASNINMGWGDGKFDLHIDRNRKTTPSTDGTHNPPHPTSVIHPSMPTADGTGKNPKFNPEKDNNPFKHPATLPDNIRQYHNPIVPTAPSPKTDWKKTIINDVVKPVVGEGIHTFIDSKIQHPPATIKHPPAGCEICKKYNNH